MSDEQKWAVEGWARYVLADSGDPEDAHQWLPPITPDWLIQAVRERLTELYAEGFDRQPAFKWEGPR